MGSLTTLWDRIELRNLERPSYESLETNEATMDTFTATITFNQTTDTYTYEETNKIIAYVIPFSPKYDTKHVKDITSGHGTKMAIFLDSGATICLGGIKYLMNLRLTMYNFIPSRKVFLAVEGLTLICQGWLHVEFVIQGEINLIITLHIQKKIQRLYFSNTLALI